MKKYQIGDNRFVVVKNTKDSPTVTIVENGSSKSIDFPFKRWVCLTRVFLPQVEEAVKQMEAGQEVKFQERIGGKVHVSVTAPYACVDIREFYWHPLLGERPTRKGIALRLHEFKRLLEIVPLINTQHPALEKTPLCIESAQHQTQESAMNCMECYPYQFDPG